MKLSNQLIEPKMEKRTHQSKLYLAVGSSTVFHGQSQTIFIAVIALA